MKITVIVPVYNEELTILNVLNQIRAQRVEGVQFEVIVCDDGSKDKTYEIVQENSHLCDRLIRLDKNSGKGAAVITALKEATGDYILFQDADLEYSPSDYSKLIFPILEFQAEIVMGSRFLAPQYTRVAYFWHKFGNILITLVFNILFNRTFTDIYSCYLVYRRDLVPCTEIKSRSWEQHAEILCKSVQRSKNIYEVPISYHGRTYEEGKKIRAYHAIGVIWMIVKCRYF